MLYESYPIAISFHVFNRPKETLKVFEKIREIKPAKLFITADAPRDSVPEDQARCNEVKAIFDNIDWECEVFRNFAKANKGSYKSTSEGITWVFDHVDRAVILEDDCVPHISFFRFCHELLDYYEDDRRVSIISGNNFQLSGHATKYSYYFSRYMHIWGWATWKRTWDQVDFKMLEWPEFLKVGGMRGIYCRSYEIKYWESFYQEMYEGKRGPHWDHLLSLSSHMNNALAILPNVNLVTNIGFGWDASNCKSKSDLHSLMADEMRFPLSHPEIMSRFIDADDYTELTIFSGSLHKSIKRRVLSYLPDKVYQILKQLLNR